MTSGDTAATDPASAGGAPGTPPGRPAGPRNDQETRPRHGHPMKTLTAVVALILAAGISALPAQASPAAEAAAGPRFTVDINASRSTVCRPLRPRCTVIFWVKVTNTGAAAVTRSTRPTVGMTLDHDFRILEVSNAADVYPQVGNIRAVIWPAGVLNGLAPGASHLYAVTARVPGQAALDPDPTINHPFPAFTSPTEARALVEPTDGPDVEDRMSLRFRP